jgi:integrase/recombinase XerD
MIRRSSTTSRRAASSAAIVRAVDRPQQIVVVPEIVRNAGANARFAWEEFFEGQLENPHTRRNYSHAVCGLLDRAHEAGLSLNEITPKFVRAYLVGLTNKTGQRVSAATEKVYLAGIRRFFDIAVVRHAVGLNPAGSVRGRKHSRTEGVTPQITIKHARKLIDSIDRSDILGQRDQALIGVLTYTAARISAVVNLRLEDFIDLGDQHVLRFREKGGKERRIPVRHDLQQMIQDYIDAANLTRESPTAPLFRAAPKHRTRGEPITLSTGALDRTVACKMLKRRLKHAGLPQLYSPHSFRVTVATDLLGQDVPLEDVQQLLGHADPRTTRIYDRRQQKITRNLVERISV